MASFAPPHIVQKIQDLYALTRKADPEKMKYADHVCNLASWYAYAYYLSLIRKYLPDKSATILDWGGQFGHVSALYQTEYPNTLCYVADQDDLLRYWQSLFGTRNIVLRQEGDTMSAISMPSNSVDLAMSSGVLEHTHEFGVAEEEALAELYRVLKPGGKLVIFHLPTTYGMPEMVNKVIGRWYHERRYSKKRILDLLSGAGFTLAWLDKHEFAFPKIRNALGQLIGQQNAYRADYLFSKLPGINFFAQHFTIVAQKPVG